MATVVAHNADIYMTVFTWWMTYAYGVTERLRTIKLYYGGAEIPAWREMLRDQNMPCVSLSYLGLNRRTKSNIKGYFPDWQEVFLDSGGYSYNKHEEKYEFEDALEFAANYMDFIKENIQYVSLVSEFDAVQLGEDFINQFREEFYNTLPPEKFMPIWHPSDGREELDKLCSTYQVVGISQSDIHGDTENIPIFNNYIQRYKVRLHGVGITSKRLIEAVKWDSVSSISWLSPSMYGDTFVWTGRELKRYPRTYKDRRKQHRSVFIDNGFDYEKIENDDSKELLRLSLWSWEQYVGYISTGNVVTTLTRNETTISQEIPSTEVDTLDNAKGTKSLVARTHQPLPVMGTLWKEEQNFDDDSTISTPHLIVRSESMRVCDNCFLKDKCPGFQPSSTCLYNIPIEIRTKDQLRSLHDALIEIQSQRVLFMKMAEDMSGGYVDPNLSAEIDRLNRMIKTKIEGDKSTFAMTVTASESSSGPGIFDKMFGTDAASKLRQLESPQNADTIIAEVLSETEELVGK